FFSSRRRHTRLVSDWSSDVCSSDLCSDAGVPVYFVKIGTAARLDGNIKQAISDGFDHLIETINPPILKHVTNPLTNERGYKGKRSEERRVGKECRSRWSEDH